MAYCPNCSSTIDAKTVRCDACGASFDGVDSWKPLVEPPAPEAKESVATQPVKVFTTAGRIGRLRYLAYGLRACFGFGLAAIILSLLFSGAAAFITWAALLTLVAVCFMLTVQRCHDFNASGWLALLLPIPFVNLVFFFAAGSEGANRYGAATPPNDRGVKIGALFLSTVAILVGFALFAVVPGYNAYPIRAQVSEVFLSSSGLRTFVEEHYARTKSLPLIPADLPKDAGTADVRTRHGTAALGPNGVITLTMSSTTRDAADKTIILQPTIAAGTLTWDCKGGTLQRKYRPRACRE